MAETLYPDLGGENEENAETEPLGSLPTVSKPRRPPPPRATQSFNQLSNAQSTTTASPNRSPGTGRQSTRGMSLPNIPPPNLSTRVKASDVFVPPPLTSGEIRWFYMESGKFWTPFNGYDSLRIEECYQRLQVSRGSSGECDVTVCGDLYEANLLDKLLKPIYWTGKEPWKIMRGVWFEVSGEKWYPVDEQESSRIEHEHRQRTWREKAKRDSDLQEWATAGVTAASGGKQQSTTSVAVVNKLLLEKYDVVWMSDASVYKMKTDVTAKLWSKLGEKVGRGQLYGGTKLVRGYKEKVSDRDRVPPIKHLVLVIHGIGQVMDGSDIAKSASDLRETCRDVATKHFPDEWKQGRVEFLPVEWRTWLSLDKGILSTITLNSVKWVRSMMHESVLDVMYYLSPRFGPEIIDGLRFQIHKQFNEFMERHPTFLSDGGTISLFAHSLGSVMVFDLLHETCKVHGISHQEPASPALGGQPVLRYESFRAMSQGGSSRVVDVQGSGQDAVRFRARMESSESSIQSEMSNLGVDEPDQKDSVDAQFELERLKQRVAELEERLGINPKPQGLNFMVDHFFAIGSPLGLFLVMREHEAVVKKGHMSAASFVPSCVCRRVHNIHHPSDPIAYRLEPLINPVYANVKSVRIDSAGSKTSQEAVDHAEGPKPETAPLQSVSKATSSWFGSLLSSSSSKKASVEPSKPKYPDKTMDNDKALRPEDKLKERLDFMLRESFTENSYLNSITAHVGYWTSPDCAKHVLLQLYKYKKTDE